MLFRRKKRKRRGRGSDSSPRAVLVRQVFIGISVITLCILIGVGVWHGTRIDSLTIQLVTVSGGETISHEEIRARVNEHLQGSYFLLVPHRFAWTYPEASITRDVAATERVRNVVVDRTSGTELAVTFTEYRPSGLWCDITDHTSCLFVDASGYAFAAAPMLDGSAFLRYSDPTRAPVVGESAYTAAAGERFRTVEAALSEQYGLIVVSVEQIAPNEVAYQLASGGILKVSEEMPVDTMLANLGTILSSEQFAHLTTGDFNYIDLRYGEKVFVKEEDAVSDDQNAITAASSTDAAVDAD